MLLGGLWHGANWTFVLWGGLHGLALVVHRLWRLSLASLGDNRAVGTGDHRGGDGRLYALAAVLLTFTWTTACFTLFRCPSIGVAIDYGHALLSGSGSGSLNPDLWLLSIVLGAGHFALFRHGPNWLPRVEAWPEPAFYVAYGIACALLPFLSPLDAEPFIYFQF